MSSAQICNSKSCNCDPCNCDPCNCKPCDCCLLQKIKDLVSSHTCSCSCECEGCTCPRPVKKRALLVGINYKGTNSELGGCLNDVANIKAMLIAKYDYREEEIIDLTDNSKEKPTYANIIKYLKWLIEDDRYTNLYFHYSGHGTWLKDDAPEGKEELDGRDECLVPLDYQTSGVIPDDILNRILREKCESAKLTCVIDACFSGTVLDLKHKVDCKSVHYTNKARKSYLFPNWTSEFTVSQNSNYAELKNIKMLSGCRDTQYSADAFINNKFQGALTYHFLKVLELNNYEIKTKHLLKDIHCMLKLSDYDQKPVLTCGEAIRMEENFSL